MPPAPATVPDPVTDHRFLDEAGDTTFYGEGRRDIIGTAGVSFAFIIGMLKVNVPRDELRREITALQLEIAGDPYLNCIPSVAKKIAKGGFYFHAKDDPPEVRERFFRFIVNRDVAFEAVAAQKITELFQRKHHDREAEFYADILSHLIKTKLKKDVRLVLNIAHRANSTSNTSLKLALEKAKGRSLKKWDVNDLRCNVVFNVQNHVQEPLLNVADYLCWSVQRVFERGDTRYYDFVGDKVRLVVDLYDQEHYAGSQHYYRGTHRLTAKNKLGPPSA